MVFPGVQSGPVCDKTYDLNKSFLWQHNSFGTLSAWVCAMTALLVCIRGIERDPCLGEWVGLRREAHADLMCV